MKKLGSLLIVCFLLPAILCAQTHHKAVPKLSDDATPEEVHNASLVIDTHADTPQRFVDENFDMDDPLKGGEFNMETVRAGHLGAEFFSIWVEPTLYKGQYVERTLALIDAVKAQVKKHPDEMMLATSPEGIEAAYKQQKLATLMGVEGGHSIDNSLDRLRQYYSLGVRYMTLTWSNSNGWADSSGDATDTTVPHTEQGLSAFGEEVVHEMNRLGMMVDISHVSDKTFYRAVAISRAPVIASHSGARALCDSPRNMTDEMLKAVATSGGPKSKGGVVQVNFYSGFVSQAYRDAQKYMEPLAKAEVQKLKEKAAREGRQVTYDEIEKIQRSYYDKIPRPPLSQLVQHIDHIAQVAGVDHVGLGSDFDGVSGQLPEGLDSPADLPKITAALMRLGYSPEDSQKILGGNLMRVFREVEQVAKDMQAESLPKVAGKQPGAKGKK